MAKCIITLQDQETENKQVGVSFNIRIELSEEEQTSTNLSAAMLLAAHYGHIFNDQGVDLREVEKRVIREAQERDAKKKADLRATLIDVAAIPVGNA
jgi:hypothetical protein